MPASRRGSRERGAARRDPGANRVRIRPNRNSIGLAALVVAMWYAGASQTNGAAYLLCFAVTGVAIVSTFHARANLGGLRVEAGAIRPVFAGEDVRVPVSFHGGGRRGHEGLHVQARGGRAVAVGRVRPEHPRRAEVLVATAHRGCFPGVTIEVTSLFPLGFCTASMRVELPQTHWVYPKPEGRLPLPGSEITGREPRTGLRSEGDDFAGVRPYRRGESQRHIDWKAVARGQPMLVRHWAGDAGGTMVLDWHDLGGIETEPRLSQLARWVLLAERRGIRYGLRLPGYEVLASNGEAHMHECLRGLAGFTV